MSAPAYRFSLGPWNIGRGADPFGPPVRPAVSFDDVLAAAVDLGFEGIQFHDDDAVPDLEHLSPGAIVAQAEAMRKKLADRGLVAEFVAPRLWEHPHGIDGGYTANDPAASGGFVGFDVKAQRTQAAESATAHLATSKAVFLRLVDKVRSFPERTAAECIAARDYEALERTVLEHLLGC